MMEPVMQMVEVEGAPIRGVLHATEKKQDAESVIKELRDIINQKNEAIEKQTEYIHELQVENSNLRSTVKMLTL